MSTNDSDTQMAYMDVSLNYIIDWITQHNLRKIGQDRVHYNELMYLQVRLYYYKRHSHLACPSVIQLQNSEYNQMVHLHIILGCQAYPRYVSSDSFTRYRFQRFSNGILDQFSLVPGPKSATPTSAKTSQRPTFSRSINIICIDKSKKAHSDNVSKELNLDVQRKGYGIVLKKMETVRTLFSNARVNAPHNMPRAKQADLLTLKKLETSTRNINNGKTRELNGIPPKVVKEASLILTQSKLYDRKREQNI